MQGDGKRKVSHKGVPKNINLPEDLFRKSLYENDPGSVTYNHIMISKKTNTAMTRQTRKVALNSFYYKLHVDSNKVSVRPHMINNEYV